MNRMAWVIGLGAMAFGVTLAVYIGSHLSNEAMSVLIGAACGVGAVLPATIVGTLALLRRRDVRDAIPHSPAQASQSPYPPVIVLSPTTLPNAPTLGGGQAMYLQGFSTPVGERQFSVIGEEEGVWRNERDSGRYSSQVK